MATYSISLPIPNTADLVAAYDRVMLYRAAGVGQPFLELTNPATRPVLAADKAVYDFSDPNGAPGFLYAAGLINTVTGAVGPMGEATSGDGSDALATLSAADIKARYLFGLPLADRRGNALPDSFFDFYIRSALAALERDLDVSIVPRTIVGEELHYKNPLSERMPIVIYPGSVPIQSVQGLRLKFPYGGAASEIPTSWLTIAKDYGAIYLYPQSPIVPVTIGIPGYGWGLGGIGDFIPNAWQIDYVAGFPRGKVPPDILDALGMMASLSPLAVLGDLVLPPGVASTSLGIDGLSQSISGKGGYADRINSYLQTLQTAVAALRRRYRGSMLRGD